jgi:hypothetical protein
VALKLSMAMGPCKEKIIKHAVDWVGREFHTDWHFNKALASGIGVHHGRIPRPLAQFAVRAFDNDWIKLLICTSTLIEGVNTKAENIIIFDNMISQHEIDYFTFNNISGRSGRRFKHFVGHVYLFHPPPHEQLPFIDIPAFSLSDDASDDLLLHLEEEDLREPAKGRVEKFKTQALLSIETLRANLGVEPESQLAIAESILDSLDYFKKIFYWHQYPSWTQLLAICELIWQNFNGPALGARSVRTAKQLAFRINQLRDTPTIRELVENQIGFMSNWRPDTHPNEAVQNVLDFNRLWANFHFPRLLRTIDRIQKELLSTRGIQSGDFSFFATQVEQFFLDPALIALEEYDILIQTSRRIQHIILKEGDLDHTLNNLKLIDLSLLPIDKFERYLIGDAILNL